MSGLIQKDIAILMQRKRSLLLMLAVGIMMGISMEGSFVVGYVTMLGAIFTISTISYDEFDNGYPFLFTLPITRGMYVRSKYIFSGAAGLLAWAAGLIICIACNLAKGISMDSTLVSEAVVILPIFLILLSIMLPLQLRYGAEGSRFVIAIIGGGAMVIGFVGSKFLPENLSLPSSLTDMNPFAGGLILCAAAMIVAFLSYRISVRIMDKKTF